MKAKFAVQVMITTEGPEPLKNEIMRDIKLALQGIAVQTKHIRGAVITKVTVRSVDKD